MTQTPQQFVDPINEDDVPPAFTTGKTEEQLTRTSCYYSLITRLADAIGFNDKSDADKVLKAALAHLEGDNK